MKEKKSNYLIHHYHSLCDTGIISSDTAQLAVIKQLQIVSDNLHKEYLIRKKIPILLRRPKLVKGIYLWGGVGIGKTFLIDMFFSHIQFHQKLRIHFHAFMQYIHLQLKIHQGEKDPLVYVAKLLAKNNLLICLDEFMVTDITDAMILRQLISALFRYGVCIVTTSNTIPDNLYARGLQRDQFLPAIESIKQHLLILHIKSQHDYRAQKCSQPVITSIKDNSLFKSENKLEESFYKLSVLPIMPDTQIYLSGRKIQVRCLSLNAVWFDFENICQPPRSQIDYLALSVQYKYIFISHIPQIFSWENNKISLFIKLIDVLYDHKVKLFYSSAHSVQHIYVEGIFLDQYKRTCSRLLEMQTNDYNEDFY